VKLCKLKNIINFNFFDMQHLLSQCLSEMGLKQKGLQLKLFAALKAYQVTSADVDTHEQDKIIESGLKALSVAFTKLLDVLYNTVMDLFGNMASFINTNIFGFTKSTSDLICTSPRAQKRWLSSIDGYRKWLQTVASIRQSPKRCACVVHEYIHVHTNMQ